ncbi:phage portal protein [Breoghania sp. L-A4]|uniref:phage portal protein n=1 Tax=Breoghania sp. L-A4 TaxID=2304600 RepID=UPI000E3581F1|nr:phage portal protein [Breoghania sp. L-A4]AXS40982.1 phage portal protein [Breoghania sp. L-A4]
MGFGRGEPLAEETLVSKGEFARLINVTPGRMLQYITEDNPQLDLTKLGYDEAETTAFVRLIKQRWKRFAWNLAECDFRGKFTLSQMVDIGLRWHIAYGEVTGVLGDVLAAQRQRYGITTGTKLCLVPPQRFVQDTSEFVGLH